MRDILIRYFENNNIDYNDKTINAFIKYRDLLVEWNKKFNLTAITDDDGIARKHFIDSLSLLDFIKNTGRLADVGAGAGFPGIPLKIAGFKGEITLMDSLNKRVGFLKTVIDELELSECSAVHMRAEDAGRGKFREHFDVVTARAVANLPVLCEYCMPLVKTGGIFIAMKGPEAEHELRDSGNAIERLGGKLREVKSLQLGEFERKIIIIDKIKETPKEYPRKPGTPKKKPL